MAVDPTKSNLNNMWTVQNKNQQDFGCIISLFPDGTISLTFRRISKIHKSLEKFKERGMWAYIYYIGLLPPNSKVAKAIEENCRKIISQK